MEIESLKGREDIFSYAESKIEKHLVSMRLVGVA